MEIGTLLSATTSPGIAPLAPSRVLLLAGKAGLPQCYTVAYILKKDFKYFYLAKAVEQANRIYWLLGVF